MHVTYYLLFLGQRICLPKLSHKNSLDASYGGSAAGIGGDQSYNQGEQQQQQQQYQDSAQNQNQYQQAEVAPQTTTSSATQSCKSYYTVCEGDTCSSISAAYHITNALLFYLNPNLNCDYLTIGQKICIPSVSYFMYPVSKCENYFTSKKNFFLINY